MADRKRTKLTVEILKNYLEYNRDTGEFIWLKNKGRARVGDIAGTNKNNGYIGIAIFNGVYQAHRLAWFYITGAWPKQYIDHINGIKTDNRFINLREATNAQNLWNGGKHANNTSGFKGVHFDTRSSKWIAQITVNCKRIHIGSFEDKLEAAEAYILESLELHGEFSNYSPLISRG